MIEYAIDHSSECGCQAICVEPFAYKNSPNVGGDVYRWLSISN